MTRHKDIQEKEKDAYINDDRKEITKEEVVWYIVKHFYHQTVLDLGCGKIKYPFKKVVQVDGNPDAEPHILHDLAVPLNLTADLVFSIEVAEHIEPEYADVFADNLANAHTWIIMTTCPPRKDPSEYTKVAHVNEQPKSYWKRKLHKRGFKYQDKMVDHMEKHFKRTPDSMKWFRNDILIFKRCVDS